MAVVPERRRRGANRYTKLLERIFHAKHSVEKTRIEFAREERMSDDLVALFEFEKVEENLRVVAEKHYRLVPPDSVTSADLRRYGERLADA